MAHDCKEQSHIRNTLNMCAFTKTAVCSLNSYGVICFMILLYAERMAGHYGHCVWYLQDSARTRRQGAIIESMHHHGKGVYSGTFSGMVVSCVAALE